MLQRFKISLLWFRDNILVILIASFIIPGALAAFNQQAEITKAIYEVDYKAAKLKRLECSNTHYEYISTITDGAGSAQVLNSFFNSGGPLNYSETEAYLLTKKSTLERYLRTLDEMPTLKIKTDRCYAELNNLYENLALTLDLNGRYQEIMDSESKKMLPLRAEQEEIRRGYRNRIDLSDGFRSVLSGDLQSMARFFKSANYSDMVKIELKDAEVEIAFYTLKFTQFNELNMLFSGELNRRFHRSLLSYFSSLF